MDRNVEMWGFWGGSVVDGGSVGNWIRIGLGGRDGGATHENKMSELTGIGNHPLPYSDILVGQK